MTARLTADARLDEMVIEVRVVIFPLRAANRRANRNAMVYALQVHAEAAAQADGKRGLRIHTVRENPSIRGEVTGTATLMSFYSSLLRVAREPPKGSGVHLC
jgi:hypothetical protein